MLLTTKNPLDFKYPKRAFITALNDSYEQMFSVIESFTDKNLVAEDHDKKRTVASILVHALCLQKCFYLKEFILDMGKQDCDCEKFETIKVALDSIQKNYDKIIVSIEKIDESKLADKKKTEWGAEMTLETAFYQSVNHFMYHVSEICTIAGENGFYKGILG